MIEKKFEQNTDLKGCALLEDLLDKGLEEWEVLESQYKGLRAVVKVLCKLDDQDFKETWKSFKYNYCETDFSPVYPELKK